MAFRIILSAAAFFGLAAITHAQPAESADHLPESFSISMTPTAAFQDWRFVYAANGRYFVEIACETDAARELLLAIYGDWEHIPFAEPLPESGQETARARLGLSMNGAYVVALPFQDRVVHAKVTALAAYHEGGGGRHGIWGVLDVEGPAYDAWLVTEGMARPADEQPSVESLPATALDIGTRDAIMARFSDHIGESVTVRQAARIPNTAFILATADAGPSTYLFTFVEWENDFLFQPLSDDWRNGGIALEEPDAEYCGAMFDSRVATLPDINGDGTPEIFIASTRSFVFNPVEIDPESGCLELVAATYFGP